MAYYPFNSDGIDTSDHYEVLPAGIYTAIVVASEMKGTKKGDGEYLLLTIEIVGDDLHKGRKVFDRLNLINNNQTAVEIARKQLARLVQACGKQAIDNSEEIHNIPFKIKIGVEPANGEREASNKIITYMSATQQTHQEPAKPKPVSGGTVNKMPWEK